MDITSNDLLLILPLSYLSRPSVVSVVHSKNIDCLKYKFQCLLGIKLLSQVQRILMVFSVVLLEIFSIPYILQLVHLNQCKNISKNTTFRGISYAYICSVCFECMIWVSKPCVCTFQENQGEKLLTKLKLTGTYCGLSIRVRKFSPDSFLIIIKRRARDRS